MSNLLPIGSIVKVGIGEDLLMITGHYPLVEINGVKGYFHYSACTYPIGVEIDDDPSLFNHEDISELRFKGFVNEFEEKMQELYKKKMKNVTYPKLSIDD